MVPDLLRFYPSLGNDAAGQVARPWRDLRNVILSLFALPDSLTGATFARQHKNEEN